MKRTYDTLLSIAFVAGLFAIGCIGLLALNPQLAGQSTLQGSLQREIEADLDQRLPLRATAIALWTATKLSLFGQTHDALVVTPDGWLFTTEEMRAPDGPDFATEIATTKARLAEKGITLIPVVVPDKSRVYQDRLARGRSAAFQSRYASALATLKSLDLPHIDLAADLQQARGTADTYLRTDTHWTPFGAEQTAKAVAQTLPRAPNPNPFTTTFGPPEPFHGDLITFVDTGAFSFIYKVAPETLTQAETYAEASADLLFADIDVPVALVGTSFSARTEFNFAGFLQQETGLDLVNYSVKGRGPFAPMQELLTSGDLFATNPKFVIWEIPERYIAPVNPA